MGNTGPEGAKGRRGREEERKEEGAGGRRPRWRRGRIGKISKQISDWARHNSDFHVCLPSDPSGLVSFGVMFKLLNYAREDSSACTPAGPGRRKGGPDYSGEGFSLFRREGLPLFPSSWALAWPREFPFSRYLQTDVAQLLVERLLTS